MAGTCRSDNASDPVTLRHLQRRPPVRRRHTRRGRDPGAGGVEPRVRTARDSPSPITKSTRSRSALVRDETRRDGTRRDGTRRDQTRRDDTERELRGALLDSLSLAARPHPVLSVSLLGLWTLDPARRRAISRSRVSHFGLWTLDRTTRSPTPPSRRRDLAAPRPYGLTIPQPQPS